MELHGKIFKDSPSFANKNIILFKSMCVNDYQMQL